MHLPNDICRCLQKEVGPDACMLEDKCRRRTDRPINQRIVISYDMCRRLDGWDYNLYYIPPEVTNV